MQAGTSSTSLRDGDGHLFYKFKRCRRAPFLQVSDMQTGTSSQVQKVQTTFELAFDPVSFLGFAGVARGHFTKARTRHASGQLE